MFVLFTLIFAFYSHLTHCEFAFKFVWHYLNVFKSLIGMHLKTMFSFLNTSIFKHFLSTLKHQKMLKLLRMQNIKKAH